MNHAVRIGVSKENYPVKRCITALQWAEFIDLEKYNIYRYVSQLQRLSGTGQERGMFRAFPMLGERGISALCLFNEVAITQLPWVSIFETVIPRIDELMGVHRQSDATAYYKRSNRVEHKVRLLAAKNCISLHSLSQSALNIQSEMLASHGELGAQVLEKTAVTHPPQGVQVEARDASEFDGKLKIVFVGNDFYRKGGGELVLALDELMEEGITGEEISVTLVGDLERKKNYALNEFQDDIDFFERIECIISKRGFVVKTNVPNAEVMAIIKDSLIGVLPTWADTYGYSILEMQSCGVPVITTNVRAVPEINFQEMIIDLPLNRFGEVVINSRRDAEKVRSQIVSGLKDKIRRLNSNRTELAALSARSITRIRRDHDPLAYFSALSSRFEPR